MDETLKEILSTLQSYGYILRHIDQRFDTLEKMLELVRANQSKITERESTLEHQCHKQHQQVDKTLRSLARRITNLESKINPIPEPSAELAGCEETP